MKCCDVRTNSLKQYHKECMKNSVEMIHVDAGLKGLIHLRDKAFIPQDKTLASREDVNLFLSGTVPT